MWLKSSPPFPVCHCKHIESMCHFCFNEEAMNKHREAMDQSWDDKVYTFYQNIYVLKYSLYIIFFSQEFVRECILGNGENYRGRKAVTKSGIPCQSWAASIPHEHKYPLSVLLSISNPPFLTNTSIHSQSFSLYLSIRSSRTQVSTLSLVLYI